MTFLNKIKIINRIILEFSDALVTGILLFGEETLSVSYNTLILNLAIDNTSHPERFHDSILTSG